MSSPNPLEEPRCIHCENVEEDCKCEVKVKQIIGEQGYVIEEEEIKVDTSSGDESRQERE